MAKITLTTLGSRYGSIDALNANFDAIEAAFENTLSRDGTTPNNLEADLDADSNRIINLADGVNNQDAATVKQVNSIVSAASTGIIAQLKERQTATRGQTIFTLSSIEYTPGSNNLAVYIDGVRQYVGESYTETSSTVVTFSSPLHINAEVLFLTNEAVDNSNLNASAVKYDPAGGVQTTVQAKLRETVSVKDFGAVGNGVTDDTAAIQAAINVGGLIYIPKATYKINGTLSLVSNLELYAEPGTKFLAEFTAESSAGYANTLITADTVSNIRITNIDFDFARPVGGQGVTPAQGAGLTMNPGISFTDCEDILFENVVLRNYISNINTSASDLTRALNFRVLIFHQCENVQVNSLTMLRLNQECLYFNNCVNVSVTNTYAYSDGDGTSTFFGFLYCDGVILSGANVTLTGGSVVNCYSRNVLIEGLRLNEGIAANGRGIDLANEAELQQYDCYNIIVRNCYINCTRYGIQGGAYTETEGSDVLTIENNDIYVVEDDNQLAGMRVDTANTVNIVNNRIILGTTTSSTIGRCIILSFQDTYPKEVGDINIVGNTMKGNCGIGQVVNTAVNCDGLYIRNNTFTAENLGAKNVSNGAAAFFFLTNSTSGSLASFEKIYMTNNVLFNLAGYFFGVIPDYATYMEIGDVVIDGNNINSPTGSLATRSALIDNPKQAGIVNTCRFSNNTIVNPSFIRIRGFYHVQVYQNLLHWNTVLTNEAFEIEDCGPGFLTVKNNDFYNHASSFDEVHDEGGNTFNVIHVIGNTNYNNAGVIELDTNFVNSAVPN